MGTKHKFFFIGLYLTQWLVLRAARWHESFSYIFSKRVRPQVIYSELVSYGGLAIFAE